MKTLLAIVVLLLSLVPCSAQSVGITPVVTAAAAATLVAKAAPGRLYKVQAANHTATAGFVVVLNAVAAPADGAITPLFCFAIAANGTAQSDFSTRAGAFNTGIVVVFTSAASCFTKTTGVITGFISTLVE
jgi:hypothetical protein